jgi:hypothetical protein
MWPCQPAEGIIAMGFIATTLFMCLFVFGPQMFSYADDDGSIKLALLATFGFGLLTGYRARG